MNRAITVIAAGVLCLLPVRFATARDIVNDGFSGANYAALSGRTPDTANAPGGKWTAIAFNSNGDFGVQIIGDSSPTVRFACAGNSNGVIAIPILSHGSYVMPQRLTIAAELAGIQPALGFYSALPGQDPKQSDFNILSNFTGLALRTDGSLALFRDGGVIASLPYTGAFDPGKFHKLTYDMDTAWGTISNVRLQGSTTDYSPFNGSGAFGDATITYAAIAAICGQGRDNQAYARNFVLAPAPVPPSIPSVSPLPLPVAAAIHPLPANAPQTIIQDVFISGSQYGAPLEGESANSADLVPSPIDLPAGPWQHIAGAYSDAREFSGGSGDQAASTDLVMFHNNAAAGVQLGSCNTGSLRISAGEYYRMRGTDALPENPPFILAGFSSAFNSPSALSTFTGLAVSGSTGSLQEYVNGAAIGRPIRFVGNYDPYSETILSYTIDTATGTISDVSFGNSGANYSFPIPASFSTSYTANAEIGGYTDGARFVVISSFILGSAPPATSR